MLTSLSQLESILHDHHFTIDGVADQFVVYCVDDALTIEFNDDEYRVHFTLEDVMGATIDDTGNILVHSDDIEFKFKILAPIDNTIQVAEIIDSYK